jgi:hypothetical protein
MKRRLQKIDVLPDLVQFLVPKDGRVGGESG